MANAIVDELVYRAYKWNRLRRPDIKAEEWAKVFNNAATMESQLQNEIKNGGVKWRNFTVAFSEQVIQIRTIKKKLKG